MRAHITYKGSLYWIEETPDGAPILVKAQFATPADMRQEKTKIITKETVA